MEQNKKLSSTWVIILIVVVILGGLIAYTVSQRSASDGTTASTTPKVYANYKDGTYSANGSYNTPGGTASIGVSLTLKNNVVTSTTVTAEAAGGPAQRWQQRFISGVNQVVVGMKLDDVSLTQVSGASLTPAGFNSAVEQIKAQAKA